MSSEDKNESLEKGGLCQEIHPELEDDVISTLTSRSRKMTEKGLSYQLELKEKAFRKIRQKLSQVEADIFAKISAERDYESIRLEYKKWLLAYEEFLEFKETFSNLAKHCDQEPQFLTTIDSFSEKLLQFKTETELWLNSQESDRKDMSDRMDEYQSKLSTGSIALEQRRAEIKAKAAALEHRQDLEMKKLKIKMEEERLELNTELAIADAKIKVLEQFENPEENENTGNFGPAFRSVLEPTRVYNQVTVPKHDDLTHPVSGMTSSGVDDLILTVIKQMRKPIPEIKQFSGNPLEYRRFLRQFHTKILVNSESMDENMNYLEQFTSGEANRIIKGYSHLDAEHGYPLAMKELEERYGDDHTIVNAIVQRALDWPPIKADNAKELDEFSIFLCECENAVQSMPAIRVLDYTENIKRLVGKLPYHYQEKFRTVAQTVKEVGDAVSFRHLVNFVKKESRKANDPIFGKEALRKSEKDKKGKKPFSMNKSKYSCAANQIDRACQTQAEEKWDRKNKGQQSENSDDKLQHFLQQKSCQFCSSVQHELGTCDKIAAVPYTNRLLFLKTKGLCFKCLTRGHMSRQCTANVVCRHCKGRHQTFLHIKNLRNQVGEQKGHNILVTSNDKNIATAYADHSHDLECDMGARDIDCAMAIIPVIVRKKNSSQAMQTYAFLDPGSSVSFCTDKLMHQLGASGRKMNITLQTMGLPHTMETYAVEGLEVCDLEHENIISMPRIYTKDKMPVTKDHIPTTRDLSRWPHLDSIVLQQLDSEIGLLIGNNVPDAYSPIDFKTGPRGSPHATKTLLGWALWNVIRPTCETQNNDHLTCYVNRTEISAIRDMEESQQLENLLRKSINFDFPESLIDEKKHLSQEDKLFMDKVEKSIRLKDGHYYIDLPFRKDQVYFPDNRQMARRRLESLRRKLDRNEKFHKDYKAFMENILANKYAEKVPPEELECEIGKSWYIPHHGIYHPRKPDKIRVVLDCAAAFGGLSLNSELLSGPNLLNSLLGILLRFRQEETAIMGDIESMYYQVRVPEEDSNFMRFYWWPDGDIKKEPEVYRMLVHIFGAISSPACSNIALRQTAMDNKNLFASCVTDTVLKDFYVDDCLSSVDSEDKASSMISDVSKLCQKGGFHVTKWTSNSHKVLEKVPQNDRAKGVKQLDLACDDLPSEHALGIYWYVESDSLGFKIKIKDKPITRRGLLSATSSVYDPLGLASPFILKAKLMQQQLCQLKLDWDELLPEKYQVEWKKWICELPQLETVNIRRCYKPSNFGKVVNCQMHIFSDASEVGYGVVAYLRLTNDANQVHCCLVMSKSRVAPLKKITIPRMELTAASLSVKLCKLLTDELDYHMDSVYLWTDSIAVLRYIYNEKSRFHTFVANRVAVIRDGSNVNQWRYVKSKLNPADAVSRGLNIEKFIAADYWFEGPKFLYDAEENWCQVDNLSMHLNEDDSEVKKTVNVTVMNKSEDIMSRLLGYFSSWGKLKRVVAWILLAKANLRERSTKKTDVKGEQKAKLQQLTPDMLEEAERALINYAQREHLGSELKVLQSSDPKIKKSSTVYRLDPILVDGMIRVGGRLDRSSISYEAKHPVLVPKESQIAKLILADIHEEVGHLGKNSMLCSLRQKYWIPGAGNLVKQIISKCVVCRRYKAAQMSQKMADLPEHRLVTNEPPFSRTGMDYFGPFFVKRGRSQVKRYGVIFTCMASRAVHLEVANSLTTDSCINSVRRFIARRGTPKVIWSDNGTNLVGCEKELRQEIDTWNQAQIHKELLKRNILWKFNPPYGSHHGGVWERLIRSVRKVLNCLLHQQAYNLNDEDLNTLFCEVEAILNARPITNIPSEPSDLSPLTPNHLLLLHGYCSMSPGDFDRGENYAKRRWRQVQHLTDVFWQRWVKEYLPMLQSRQKWIQPKRNVMIGDIVLLVDNTPRNSWTMGKITEVYPDHKGYVRSVKVKTSLSEFVRPVEKLCLLLESD